MDIRQWPDVQDQAMGVRQSGFFTVYSTEAQRTCGSVQGRAGDIISGQHSAFTNAQTILRSDLLDGLKHLRDSSGRPVRCVHGE